MRGAGGKSEMRILIENMVRALVDEPDFVSVKEIGGMHTSILELRVCKSDIGKVIGKQGRTADALRTILNAASAKLSKRVFLDIMNDLNH